jgi:hypothetical protein
MIHRIEIQCMISHQRPWGPTRNAGAAAALTRIEYHFSSPFALLVVEGFC